MGDTMNIDSYTQIKVTGLCPWMVLAALHNRAKVSDTAVCRSQSRGNISAEEARAEAPKWVNQTGKDRNAPRYPDYLFGRPIKAYLYQDGHEVILSRVDVYNKDAGSGAAQEAIDGLLAAILASVSRTQQEA